MEKKRKWHQTTQLPPSANAPPRGTRHHRTANVPGPPQRHRTRQSWNTSRNYCRAATRPAPSGRDPGLWRDLVRHWLNITSIQLLTPVFSHSNAAHQQHTGTTQQHATAPAANHRHREPETARRTANTLLPPKPLARPSWSLASCLEQPGFAAQVVPLKRLFSYDIRHSTKIKSLLQRTKY